MVKWGIVGTGSIARKFAVECKLTTSGRPVAAYGRNQERLNEFCMAHDLLAYNELDVFLNDADLDAVYIGAPHSAHAELSIQAILAGKHVLCEKPFSYNYKRTKEVLDLARSKNVFVMEALWTLFLPAIQKASLWLKEGRIGKLRHIDAKFCFKGDDNTEGRLLNPMLAGGSLLDVGIYPLLLAQYLMGSAPNELSAKANMTETGVDGHLGMLLSYDDGTIATLTSSIEFETDWTATLYGDKGKIVIPNFFMAKEAYLHVDGEVLHDQENYEEDGYRFEIEEASQRIIEGKTESNISSHKFTETLAKTMDRVRKEINLIYPIE
ncbi:MAG: Gfo/Idh/MocA family oxidoreductase [Clostridia bacterium]|nr:Gfo/Idh/MocA family oxidoreductase [Clostridia bacterium]